MTEFRLTQISDTHLARRLQQLTDNFHRVSEHIDATRPDLVINSGDISFDGPTSRSDLEFARELHDALPVPSFFLNSILAGVLRLVGRFVPVLVTEALPNSLRGLIADTPDARARSAPPHAHPGAGAQQA